MCGRRSFEKAIKLEGEKFMRGAFFPLQKMEAMIIGPLVGEWGKL